MFQWLIEAFTAADKSAQQYLVKAKTYGEACTVVSKHHGECSYKLLGQFEQLSLEKSMHQRIA